MFLEISQNSQENTRPKAYNFIKKRLWHRCFPVNFAKFLRTSFLQNTSGRLLLCVSAFAYLRATSCRNWDTLWLGEKSSFIKIFGFLYYIQKLQNKQIWSSSKFQLCWQIITSCSFKVLGIGSLSFKGSQLLHDVLLKV